MKILNSWSPMQSRKICRNVARTQLTNQNLFYAIRFGYLSLFYFSFRLFFSIKCLTHGTHDSRKHRMFTEFLFRSLSIYDCCWPLCATNTPSSIACSPCHSHTHTCSNALFASSKQRRKERLTTACNALRKYKMNNTRNAVRPAQ